RRARDRRALPRAGDPAARRHQGRRGGRPRRRRRPRRAPARDARAPPGAGACCRRSVDVRLHVAARVRATVGGGTSAEHAERPACVAGRSAFAVARAYCARLFLVASDCAEAGTFVWITESLLALI